MESLKALKMPDQARQCGSIDPSTAIRLPLLLLPLLLLLLLDGQSHHHERGDGSVRLVVYNTPPSDSCVPSAEESPINRCLLLRVQIHE